MTKEEIINTVLNLDIISIEDIQGYTLFNKNLSIFEGAILSVCSRGVVVTYDNGDRKYMYALTPFEEIKKITYSKAYLKTEIIE